MPLGLFKWASHATDKIRPSLLIELGLAALVFHCLPAVGRDSQKTCRSEAFAEAGYAVVSYLVSFPRVSFLTGLIKHDPKAAIRLANHNQSAFSTAVRHLYVRTQLDGIGLIN